MKIRENTKESILILLLCSFVMILLYIICKPMYESVDDMAMIGILSGTHAGIKSYDATFLSPILGWILYQLYDFKATIPWYSLTLYLAQLISLYLGVKLITLIVKEKYLKILNCFSFFIIYMYMFYRLSFASSSLMLCFISCIYILYLQLKEINIIKKWVMLGLSLSFSYLIRPSIITVCVPFTVFIFIFVLFYKSKKKLAFLFIPLVIVFIGNFMFCSYIKRNDSHYVEYRKLQSSRSMFIDTKLGMYNVENKDKIKKNHDWSVFDYQLGREWWVHNEKIYNSNNFEKFIKLNNDNKSIFNSFVSIKEGVINLYHKKAFFALIFVNLVLLLFSREKMEHKEFRYKKISTKNILLISFVLILFGYIVLSCIRFPERVAMPILIYIYVFSIILTILLKEDLIDILKDFYTKLENISFAIKIKQSIKIKHRQIRSKERKYDTLNKIKNYLEVNIDGSIMKRSLFLFCIFIIIIVSWNKFMAIKNDTNIRLLEKECTEQSIKKVTKENSNKMFMVLGIDFVRYDCNPFKEYSDNYTINQLPGIWLVGSDVYYRYLNKFGMKSGQDIIPFAMDNDDVVFAYFQRNNGYYSFKNFSYFFGKHIKEHYAKNLNVNDIKFKIVYSSVGSHVFKDQNYGWVFFKLNKNINNDIYDKGKIMESKQ